MAYTVRKKLLRKPSGKILRDDLILLKNAKSRSQYPELLRRVEMLVEVDGKEIAMVFLTNNTEWAPSSVGGLCQARWGIGVFFKQIKQTLQVSDFLGHSKQAIRWQLWAALLLYVLMRWQGQAAGWSHSFARLLAMVRGVVWDRIDLAALLKSYGTAGGHLPDAKLLRRHVSAGVLTLILWNSTCTKPHRNRHRTEQTRKTESPTKPSSPHATRITPRHSDGYGMTVETVYAARYLRLPLIPRYSRPGCVSDSSDTSHGYPGHVTARTMSAWCVRRRKTPTTARNTSAARRNTSAYSTS